MSKSGLKRITLHLARTKEFPNGSPHHGYELVAPLDAKDHIDPDAWHKARGECTVKRFWGHEEQESGHLIRKPGGSWAFHYDTSGDEDDDEAGYRFQSHVFREGEYVSLKDGDGELHPFIVSYIEDLSA